MTPLITVIMCFFNPGEFLRSSLASLLKQTVTDFEILLIDDCSSDGSSGCVEKLNDPRIKLIKNPENLGLTRSLNIGLDRAKGKLIARMDADDICLPERFEKQLGFLKKNPSVSICGTGRFLLSPDGKMHHHSAMILQPEEIRCRLLFENCIAHPTVMMKRDFLDRYCLKYNPGFKYAQDYELWTRAVFHGELANIPEPLLIYRHHPNQIASKKGNEQENWARLARKNFIRNLGLEEDSTGLAIHEYLATGFLSDYVENIQHVNFWLEKLKTYNRKYSFFPEPQFEIILKEKTQAAFHGWRPKNLKLWSFWKKGNFGKMWKKFPKAKWFFFLKCILGELRQRFYEN